MLNILHIIEVHEYSNILSTTGINLLENYSTES